MPCVRICCTQPGCVNPDRDFDDEIWGLGLRDIALHLQSMGGRTLAEFHLPVHLADAVGALSADLLVQQERDRYPRAEQAALLADFTAPI